MRVLNNLDVAGVLRTYAEKARLAKDTEHLREVVRDLKQELDLRKIHMNEEEL